MRKIKVAIIGAGTAGLTARKEVAKRSSDYLVFDGGVLGTTCARVGCMPSKVLLQVAKDFARRHKFTEMGIQGGDALQVDIVGALSHTRRLRDRFVKSVFRSMQDWEDKLIRQNVKFLSPWQLQTTDGQVFEAEQIIVATGSRPIIPPAWQACRELLLTTDDFFEQPSLPKKMAVIGLGVIGLELGQALQRLGVELIAIQQGEQVAGISDPELATYVWQKLSEEINLSAAGVQSMSIDKGRLKIQSGSEEFVVDKALVAIGRKANTDFMGWQEIGIATNERGIPPFDPLQFRLSQYPHIFFVGDVNGERPLLHEAADEGHIAGYSIFDPTACFQRRCPMAITFSDPNIAMVGKSYRQLMDAKVEFVTGKVSFEGQGRSIVKLQEQGLLHVYVARDTGFILGAELQAPEGEHLAHLLAWAISLRLSVREALSLPFYHPVLEEALRSALRSAAKQLPGDRHDYELLRCQDPPIR